MSNLGEDQQVIRLRRQLIKLCPEEQNQIMIMDKNDLQDLLAVVSNVPNNVAEQKRKEMEAKILQVCPGMDRELKDLGDDDIQDIYLKCLDKQKQTLAKKRIPSMQLNVNDMKRVLMEKLPGYRNGIKNMADIQIRRMYKELQDELKSNSTQRVPYKQSSRHNFMANQNVYPENRGMKETGMQDGQRKPRNAVPSDQRYSGARNKSPDQFLNIKESMKLRKLKHKCKISFYFNESDFEDENEKNNEGNKEVSEKRKNVMSKIVEGLYKVFNKKKWQKGQKKQEKGQLIQAPSKQNSNNLKPAEAQKQKEEIFNGVSKKDKEGGKQSNVPIEGEIKNV